jgi:predicted negative regulator of RcsB-dependent stress response
METGTSQTQSTETFYKAMAWLHANQKRLLIALGVVAGLGLVVGISAWNKARVASDANAKLFELPVSSAPNMPVIAPGPSAYLNLAHEYPNTSAGGYAELLGAESLFVDGNYAEAQQEFSKYSENYPESPLAAQAQVGVAACLEAEGKSSDAIQKYTAIISTYPNEANITEPAKLTLARLYEQANRPDQSLALYSDLARSQNPYDPWASEARDRGELLLTKHPELQRAQQAPAATPAPFSISPPQAPASTAPPAQTKPNPAAGLLNFPAASSNLTGKP